MGALEFCRQYKIKLAEDKSLLENPMSVANHLIENRYRTSMSVYYNREWLGGIASIHPIQILNLDGEDLEYLYNKYKLKAEEELSEALEKFKQDHANI